MRVGYAVAVLFSVAGLLSAGAAAAPARACACGGVVSAGDRATVGGETAVASWDGRRETVLMRLDMRFDGDRAALIVPTPTPATVRAGDAAVFGELARLTAPERVTETDWFGSPGFDGASAGAPGGAPTVHDQVRLGPLEATTLSGGDLTGLRAWLDEHGYTMKPEVTATLDPYLRDGWSFVALRLTGSTALTGALDPVAFAFDTDRFVYPMRMSAAATAAQSVRLYLLGEHRLARTDADAATQSTRTAFAGRVDLSGAPALAALAPPTHTYLTELAVSVPRPAAITTDFTFAAAPTDDPVRDHYVTREYVDILGLPAGYVLIVAGLSAVVVAGAVVVGARRRHG
ncbi:DUF2330 domain-containing protein [Nocardia thailandica]